MPTLLQTLLPCLSPRRRRTTSPLTYTPDIKLSTDPAPEDEAMASRLLTTLLRAEKPGKTLQESLQHDLDLTGEVRTQGWYETVAAKLLAGMERAIEDGKAIGGAVGEVLTHARTFAADFIREHPVYTAVIVTIVALGVLYLLWPWVVSALGFGEAGPVAGSWAARFQAMYGPEVPAGSLFSALQRLGMVMGKGAVVAML
ncbi:uncharacterized protein BDZ99DRAFT_415695 [Mytilinidion resinicola]|uniref:Uncharacterized protein n=1 Tax=Mytilinidion resinicola TaxID=574789 RepID=A0A6A6YTH3_9PEZI|nr:uncharacterized protein BDZ99DRAFT_415695 [Mytilinidion resinicola]KAF2811207.1 hypothetical protein BDZ99DRAFT_415695 [Mytilinidion resinicola]